MTVRYNVSVRSFSFWGDAINTRCVLSDEQCDREHHADSLRQNRRDGRARGVHVKARN